jgi:hypothetical protein
MPSWAAEPQVKFSRAGIPGGNFCYPTPRRHWAAYDPEGLTAMPEIGGIKEKDGEHAYGDAGQLTFRYVRHPLYLGCILFYLGLALGMFSLFSLVLWVAICICYNYLASYEEKLLEARFGESYRSYREKTGKWLPRMPCIHQDQDAVC